MKMNSFDLSLWVEKIYSYAISKTRDADEAEDLTQDIFIELLKSVQKSREITDLERYIMSVAKYVWYEHLRRRYNEPISYFGFSDESVLEQDDFTARFELNAEYIGLRRQIAMLSRLHRDVITLYYFGNRSLAEIASQLDIPLGTVKSRLYGGKIEIKRGMEMNEQYGMASMEPQKLNLGIDGMQGKGHSPFCLIENDLLAQNILLEAYQEPLTEKALAERLGIAAAYVESETEKLVAGGLMKRQPNGTVQTDFIIMDARLHKENIRLGMEYVQDKADDLFKELTDLDGQVKHIAPMAKLDFNHRMLIVLMVLQSNAFFRNFDRLKGIHFEDYPIRAFGGRWFAIGLKQESYSHEDEYLLRYFSISGMLSSENDDSQLADYDFIYSRTHQSYLSKHIEQPEIRTVIDKLYNKVALDRDDKAICETLLELEMVRHSGESFEPNIPVFTKAEWDQFGRLLDPLTAHPALDSAYVIDKSEEFLKHIAPKNLASQYRIIAAGAQGGLIMAILKQLTEEKKLVFDEKRNYPAMWMRYKK